MNGQDGASSGSGPAIVEITRPDPSLLRYFTLVSLLTGPLFPLVFLPRAFRYVTLRYRFDDRGVSVSWGVLFRKEIHLTYSRIQDIHLGSNALERWMGLARIEVQTASGSAKAELVIEGIKEYAQVRDFIYARMRGLEDAEGHAAPASQGVAGEDATGLARALDEVARELRAIRAALDGGGGA